LDGEISSRPPPRRMNRTLFDIRHLTRRHGLNSPDSPFRRFERL
jgi:hypothetical protein